MVQTVSTSLPELDVVFQLTTGHCFSAMVSEGTSHGQLLQQFVDQKAGLPAGLQHEGFTAHRTEVTLQQEAGETLLAISMSAGRVQRLDEWLQTDVTDEVIVHFILVKVLMVLFQLMTVAT